MCIEVRNQSPIKKEAILIVFTFGNMNTLARLLFPFQVLGIVLGSDLGVPLLIEYGRAEHVMCQVPGKREGVVLRTLFVIKQMKYCILVPRTAQLSNGRRRLRRSA